MTIDIKPETQKLLDEEVQSGHFHSVDEVIVESVHAWRERFGAQPPTGKPRKELVDALTPAAFASIELDLGHDRGAAPLSYGPRPKTAAEAVAHIRESRKGNLLPSGVTIGDLINEGRA